LDINAQMVFDYFVCDACDHAWKLPKSDPMTREHHPPDFSGRKRPVAADLERRKKRRRT